MLKKQPETQLNVLCHISVKHVSALWPPGYWTWWVRLRNGRVRKIAVVTHTLIDGLMDHFHEWMLVAGEANTTRTKITTKWNKLSLCSSVCLDERLKLWMYRLICLFAFTSKNTTPISWASYHCIIFQCALGIAAVAANPSWKLVFLRRGVQATFLAPCPPPPSWKTQTGIGHTYLQLVAHLYGRLKIIAYIELHSIFLAWTLDDVWHVMRFCT